MNDVVVLGGGIVGAAAAYRLMRRGVRVVLVDREDQGQATAAGAGIISPGTTLHPRPEYYPLADRSVDYYKELLEQLTHDGERETGYNQAGLMHVALDENEARSLPTLLRFFKKRQSEGAPLVGAVRLLDSKETTELFPALGPTYGSAYSSGAARVDGNALRSALLRAAVRRGVKIVHGSGTLETKTGRVIGVRVSRELLPADGVVIATGSWTGRMKAEMGVQLPIEPQRGQILHLRMGRVSTERWPIVMSSIYLLTFPPDRVVAGATHESVGFDSRATVGGVHEVLSAALRLAPGLADAEWGEMRVGFRPVTPDGLPVLGFLPDLENVFVAAGHGAFGLQLGPYSGALAADLLFGDIAPLDLNPYSPNRFLEDYLSR